MVTTVVARPYVGPAGSLGRGGRYLATYLFGSEPPYADIVC
jgi:hypothetical protein